MYKTSATDRRIAAGKERPEVELYQAEILEKEMKEKERLAPITCRSCGATKQRQGFYKNKHNEAGRGFDFWCRKCVKDYVTSKNALMQYCNDNNRLFSDDLWNRCELEAGVIADDEPSVQESIATKTQFIKQETIKRYLASMNDDGNYMFSEEVVVPTAPKEVEDDPIYLDDGGDKLVYSRDWFGEYTVNQIAFMDDFYEKLKDQFDLTDVHLEDNAREIVKSSLEVKLAQQRYRISNSKENLDAVTKAIANYTKLSDQAKFSASKRTVTDRVGFSNLGQLISVVESTGALYRKVEFEKDDVDFLREHYIAGILQSMQDEDIRLEDD